MRTKPQTVTGVARPIAAEQTADEIARELRARLVHFYGQTDGSLRFPNSCEGDLLKMTHRLLCLTAASGKPRRLPKRVGRGQPGITT